MKKAQVADLSILYPRAPYSRRSGQCSCRHKSLAGYVETTAMIAGSTRTYVKRRTYRCAEHLYDLHEYNLREGGWLNRPTSTYRPREHNAHWIPGHEAELRAVGFQVVDEHGDPAKIKSIADMLGKGTEA